MAKLFNKMLNFVGWEEDDEVDEGKAEIKEEVQQPQFMHSGSKKQQNKVVNIHTAAQFKVVIMQPQNIDDAQDICDHLKNKKPIVVNLEDVEKEQAQRILDFMRGSVYALDGNIQKVSNEIFLVAPNNVDITGDFKDELSNKGVFPWMK